MSTCFCRHLVRILNLTAKFVTADVQLTTSMSAENWFQHRLPLRTESPHGWITLHDLTKNTVRTVWKHVLSAQLPVLVYCYIKRSAIVSLVLGELWLVGPCYEICPERRRIRSCAFQSRDLRRASTEALLVILHHFTRRVAPCGCDFRPLAITGELSESLKRKKKCPDLEVRQEKSSFLLETIHRVTHYFTRVF